MAAVLQLHMLQQGIVVASPYGSCTTFDVSEEQEAAMSAAATGNADPDAEEMLEGLMFAQNSCKYTTLIICACIIMAGGVPSVDCIYKFLSRIYREARYSPECHIIALVYINRVLATTELLLTLRNWRCVTPGYFS